MTTYCYYGDSTTPPIPQRYRNEPLPADMNADPAIMAMKESLKNEPHGKEFIAMLAQFEKNKWYGYVVYELNGRKVAKFHYMSGVIIRKDLFLWPDGWGYQNLKKMFKKRDGALIAFVEAMQTTMNENVKMKRGKDHG